MIKRESGLIGDLPILLSLRILFFFSSAVHGFAEVRFTQEDLQNYDVSLLLGEFGSEDYLEFFNRNERYASFTPTWVNEGNFFCCCVCLYAAQVTDSLLLLF
tara:strand:- start:284 stop:589 length:306 start_codon:yes stop_codon:yes gene_type:complete